MDRPEHQRTFLDYRNNLRKVDTQESRSASGPEVSSPSQPQTPFAIRQAHNQSNGHAQSPPLGFTDLKPSQSVHTVNSRSSSISSYRQPTVGTLETSSPSQRPQTATDTTVATPSVYSQQSSSEPVYGPRHLLIITCGTAKPDLQQHIQTSVNRHDIGAVILLGADEEALKKSKMDCYTVAGKLEKNLSVSTTTIKSTEDPDALRRSLASLQNKNIRGVLVYPADSIAEEDILDLDEGDMNRAWRISVLTLQTIARHTLPLLTRTQAETNSISHSSESRTSFFAVERRSSQDSAPTFHSTVHDTLLQSIARSPAALGVKIGYSQNVLPPLPSRPVQRDVPSSSPAVAIPIPGMNGSGQGTARHEEVEQNLSESPTKLWASWAMQEGAF